MMRRFILITLFILGYYSNIFSQEENEFIAWVNNQVKVEVTIFYSEKDQIVDSAYVRFTNIGIDPIYYVRSSEGIYFGYGEKIVALFFPVNYEGISLNGSLPLLKIEPENSIEGWVVIDKKMNGEIGVFLDYSFIVSEKLLSRFDEVPEKIKLVDYSLLMNFGSFTYKL